MIPADDRTPVSEWEPTTLDDIYQLLINLRPDWHQYAACRGMAAEHHPDGNVFFPEHGDKARAGKEARQICRTCPVEPECLEFGLTQRDGIWGGTTHNQRKTIRAQRNARLPVRLEPCGTEAGYARHYRRREPVCQPCRTAHRLAHQERRERNQAS